MIATSRKNLTLGATVCTLAMVAGYVWICRGDQPATKQTAQGEIEKIVREKDAPKKPTTLVARPEGDTTNEPPIKTTIKKPTGGGLNEKVLRGRGVHKPKKDEKTPAV